jgi:hypothetical protein
MDLALDAVSSVVPFAGTLADVAQRGRDVHEAETHWTALLLKAREASRTQSVRKEEG